MTHKVDVSLNLNTTNQSHNMSHLGLEFLAIGKICFYRNVLQKSIICILRFCNEEPETRQQAQDFIRTGPESEDK